MNEKIKKSQKIKYTHIVVHYDEIGLKGKNRGKFELQLIKNIKDNIKEEFSNIRREYGQLIIQLKEKHNTQIIMNRLKKTPGIANFSFCIEAKNNIKDIMVKTLEISEYIDENEEIRIETKRHNKEFKKKSFEMNKDIGEYVLSKKKFKVNLKNPSITILVEICNKNTYISIKKYQGTGGLPCGSAKKLLCLLSGGLDSPVSSYMVMKRGAKCVFIHFQNEGQMKKSVENKIELLVKKLSEIQGDSKLYIIPFEEIQKQIIMKVPAKLRMVIYRRFMVRIADNIADNEKIQALVMGDSLSQVASQTIPNLCNVYNASKKPILSPLIGLNKREVTDLAIKIDTYETSIIPYGDCCSFFVDKHPQTNSKQKEIEMSEKELDIENLVEKASNIANMKIIKP